ncbi:response regulator transcription factor [Paenibacillus bovis]|uniref:Transcriptional regulator n=1 Tax=Paenibacillus bovis TaxID=1616788 RepID=A0A1X9T4J5_9BACL|nr:response regulator transcription factor [Paenibacillus bovis]ARR10804.1 transcriptional regulator [Paenibacillus bovis]
MKHILVVDDEDKIRDVVSSYLSKDGFRIEEAITGEEALSKVRQTAFDLIVLDLMLPDMAGEKVCQTIRSFSSLPILMLSAKASDNHRIRGLSIGADDYLIKPFDPREVVARVRAILRRANENHILADKVTYDNGRLIINAVQQKVICEGQVVNLTPNEFKILMLLARQPNRLFTRDDLVDRVLGYDFGGSTRTIDQHVKNLRSKIEKDPRNPYMIQTVYGAGYRFQGDL